jgi:drug/metabolite transporter (DMT)-like permease
MMATRFLPGRAAGLAAGALPLNTIYRSVYSRAIMQRIGELAAFGTAVCWTISALFFERASKRMGVLAVNFYKLIFAFGFLLLTAVLMRGVALPLDASPRAWLFLSLSGLIGFVITDIFLFSAYVMIGSRITMLFLAMSPPMTAILGYVFLGETMGARGLLGMAMVAAGIALAVLSRQDARSAVKRVVSRNDKLGYLYAFLSTLGQSVGMIFTKIGLGDYHPIAGTQIRVFAGIVILAVISLFWEKGRPFKAALDNRTGLATTFGGAIFGPFLGVALSLFAVQRTNTGIVSTLLGLTPILIIIPSILLFKQKVKPLEIVGALLAVLGSAVFFM